MMMDFITRAEEAPPTPLQRQTPVRRKESACEWGHVVHLIEPGWEFPGAEQRGVLGREFQPWGAGPEV